MSENIAEEPLVKTSDQLDDADKENDAAAQEEDEQPAADDDTIEAEESADVTTAGVVGQAGIGNA
jgi:hypothetical protein